MKKFLKNLLICCFIIPVLFVFGCKDSTTPPPTTPSTGQESGGSQSGSGSGSGSQSGGSQSGSSSESGSQSGSSSESGSQSGGSQSGGSQVTPQQTAYAILNNIAKEDIYAGFSKVEVEITEDLHMAARGFDISETTLTEEEWYDYLALTDLGNDPVYTPSDIPSPSDNNKLFLGAIDKTNNTGYKTEYQPWGGYQLKTTQIYEGQLVNFVLDPNQSFYNTAEKVTDESSVVAQYEYNFENLLEISSVFEAIGATSSYLDLPVALNTIVSEVYEEYEYGMYLTPEGNYEITAEINLLEDDQYELVILAKYGKFGTNDDVVFTKYTLTFDDESLKSIVVDNGTMFYNNYFTRSELRSMFEDTGLDVNAAFPSGCKVYLAAAQYEKTIVTFNVFDESNFITDFTGFDLSTLNQN